MAHVRRGGVGNRGGIDSLKSDTEILRCLGDSRRDRFVKRMELCNRYAFYTSRVRSDCLGCTFRLHSLGKATMIAIPLLFNLVASTRAI